VLKAGWFIGGAGGSGVLTFHGRRYPVSIGGLSAGPCSARRKHILSASSATLLTRRTSQGSMGPPVRALRFGVGAGTIVLKNEKGAVLSLNGREVGLIANVDLSGMAISLH
jgi:hypothetical protein